MRGFAVTLPAAPQAVLYLTSHLHNERVKTIATKLGYSKYLQVLNWLGISQNHQWLNKCSVKKLINQQNNLVTNTRQASTCNVTLRSVRVTIVPKEQ